MKKPNYELDKYLREECERLDIDPDWYETKRELYRAINRAKSAEGGRKRRESAKKVQSRRLRYEDIEDENGETNIPKHKIDKWGWDQHNNRTIYVKTSMRLMQ